MHKCYKKFKKSLKIVYTDSFLLCVPMVSNKEDIMTMVSNFKFYVFRGPTDYKFFFDVTTIDRNRIHHW